ncbi:phage tail terminator protein [Salmonella enterica]
MSTDYLFCEPLIIERLRAETTGFVEITGAAGLAQITGDSVPAPAAYVVYLGDVVSDLPGATGGALARQQFITQLWAVVVAVYYADGRGLGEDLSNAAGPFISQVIDTLSGWQPANRVRPLRRHPQQIQAQYDNGYGYFPLIFQVQIPASLGGY